MGTLGTTPCSAQLLRGASGARCLASPSTNCDVSVRWTVGLRVSASRSACDPSGMGKDAYQLAHCDDAGENAPVVCPVVAPFRTENGAVAAR